MTTTQTWSFGSGYDGWTFADTSTANATATRSYVSGAIRNTLDVQAAAGTRRATGENTSPTLNAPIANNDTIAVDYGASSDAQNIRVEIYAFYTDITSETNSVGSSGAGTLTLTMTQSKTLDYIRVDLWIQEPSGLPGNSRNASRDILEIRLATSSAASDYNVTPTTSALDGTTPGDLSTIMTPSQSGQHVFIGMQGLLGTPIVIKVNRPTSTTPTVAKVYAPGAGTNVNISDHPNIDKMIFHGNFGTDLGVTEHAIGAGTNTDKSPASIGAKLIQPLRVDFAGGGDHIIAVNRNDQDAIETTDGGDNWAAINATLGQDVDAMDVGFFGDYIGDVGVIGGNDGTDEHLGYTPNEFVSFREDTSAALKAVGAIVSIDRINVV